MSFMKELDPSAARLVRGRHLAGRHLEGSKQRRRAVALVIVAVAGQRPPGGQLQVALRPLQRLDRGLLVDADDNRILRRRYVQPDHVGRLGGKLRIIALAPRLAAIQVDLVLAQHAPHLLLMHVAQLGGDHASGPAGKTGRRRAIQNGQDTLIRLHAVLGPRTGPRLVAQPGQTLTGIPTAPQADRARHGRHLARDRPRRAAGRRQQNDPRPHHIALFARRRSNPGLKHGSIPALQANFCCIRNHQKVESRISLLQKQVLATH
jgi:hypothetical protein